MEIISRKEAKLLGQSYYFTGRPCKHGHTSKRLIDSGVCYTCSLLFKKTEKSKKSYRIYRQIYKDKVNKRSVIYWKNTVSEKMKLLRQTNPTKGYKAQRKWEKLNPGKLRATNSKRRAAKYQAIPSWFYLERTLINELYKESNRLSKETGILYTIDHIVPLQHPLVCGLHCLSNLRIITGTENFSKNNKLIEELCI